MGFYWNVFQTSLGGSFSLSADGEVVSLGICFSLLGGEVDGTGDFVGSFLLFSPKIALRASLAPTIK